MLIGYSRISKHDGSQSLDLQHDALQAAGVPLDRIYDDQASGKHEARPGLLACLKALRASDTLVIWKLFGRLRCQWILIFCQAEAIAHYQAVLGDKYRRPLFWIKPDGLPQFSGDRPAMGYESVVCAWGCGGRSHWNAGGKRGVYTHMVHEGDARIHSTQKPLPLMAELVRDFTQPGDVILDPFMGGATTGVACLHEGRRFIGIELDPSMYARACDRLEAATRQGQLFPVGRPSPTQAPLFGTTPSGQVAD